MADSDLDLCPYEAKRRRAGERLDLVREEAEEFFADLLERLRDHDLWDGSLKDAESQAEEVARAAMKALAPKLNVPYGMFHFYTKMTD